MLHLHLKRTVTESFKMLKECTEKAEDLLTNPKDLLQRMIPGFLDSFESACVCNGSYLFFI